MHVLTKGKIKCKITACAKKPAQHFIDYKQRGAQGRAPKHAVLSALQFFSAVFLLQDLNRFFGRLLERFETRFLIIGKHESWTLKLETQELVLENFESLSRDC